MLFELQVRLPRAWCGGRGHLGKDRLAGRRAHTEDPCVQGIHKLSLGILLKCKQTNGFHW